LAHGQVNVKTLPCVIAALAFYASDKKKFGSLHCRLSLITHLEKDSHHAHDAFAFHARRWSDSKLPSPGKIS
jgi:hypothetical protein